MNRNRFELENYRNVLFVDDWILLSYNFYQSPEHYKYRTQNSKKDFLRKIRDIKEFQFNSIGDILNLDFGTEKKKLIFSSNERMLEFLDKIISEDFQLIKQEKVGNKSIFYVIPIVIGFLIYFYLKSETYTNILNILKDIGLMIGVCIGIVEIVKETSNSKVIKYKRKA